jgi:LmbE family N-acetylglucosaminyl deacetylase
MIKIGLPTIQTILCLGAHCDDIEIGCGAAILRLIELYPRAHICWVVFSSSTERAKEAKTSAERFLADAGSREILIKSFRDGFFPWQGAEIKERFEELKAVISPELIFSHHGQDRHQDHRVISELTWNTWRNHLILEYEIPKYDGDLGSPNFFVQVSEDHRRRKLRYLMECYVTQIEKGWFSDDTFTGLMRLRGMESNSPTSFSEAFYVRKICY